MSSSETASPSAPPAATEPPLLVVVNLTSQPSGARIVRERDGAALGSTPFTKSWTAGTGVEKLRIEVDGYKTESVAVPLDRGVDLAIRLKRIPVTVVRKRSPGAPVSPQPETGPAPAPSPAAPAKPPPRAEPAAL